VVVPSVIDREAMVTRLVLMANAFLVDLFDWVFVKVASKLSHAAAGSACSVETTVAAVRSCVPIGWYERVRD